MFLVVCSTQYTLPQEANARNLIHVSPNSNNMGVVNVEEYCKKIAMKNVNIIIICALFFVWRLKVLKSQGQHNSDIQPLANALANKLSPEKQDTLTNIQSTLIETNNVRFMNLSFKQWYMTIFYTTPPKWKSENKFRLCVMIHGGILNDKHSLMCVILKDHVKCACVKVKIVHEHCIYVLLRSLNTN